MNFMLMLYADEAAGQAVAPDEMAGFMTELFAYKAALEKAGAFIATSPLAPTTQATTVRVRNGRTEIQDGPYAETREQLGGYYIISVRDEDEARLWASRCPAAHWGSIEVRPLMELTPVGL